MPKKLTLDIAHEIAKKHDGECLSTEYINSITPMLWKCHQGHIWSTPFNNIKNIGLWCHQCAGNARLEDAKKLALSRNGYCNSKVYINSTSLLEWECKYGHTWTAPYSQIKNKKSWCPTCYHYSSRKTIDEMHQHARSRKGDCLSDKYYNIYTKLKWICKNSHIWEACPEDVLRGTWCPVCADNISYTIENAKQIASDRNGECLSTEYINNRSKLLWKCIEGHLWSAPLSSIKLLGHWCPYCAGNARLTIEDMHTLARKKGGGCLSDKYFNNSTKLKWVCKNNHIWEAVPASVQRGSWCPFCSRFTREKLCREIVSKYLGPPSKIRRPDFLKTPEYHQGLELDIPYYDYGFAIEVQGEQHEKFNKFFHRGDPNNFIKQQERDQLKKELCEENRIALRYVWYYEDPYIVIPKHLQELGLIE
ncbi:hypothetical protein C1645_841925 [Glomus cerebriforme]|uniref:Zinc-ribbon domain-containing protein n=1 Tax=Glomus cerebriforme TaxID=658196 RepID=A0A397S2K7_9GLOM|nr:hypothetical protein C1645_841925 [Glomus cerebriforme]